MRAKFTIYSETRDAYGCITFKARPVGGNTPENQEFFKTTPSGEISVTVKVAETDARLELGSDYFVDFIKA